MCNPLPEYGGEVTHDYASILDSKAEGISVHVSFDFQ